MKVIDINRHFLSRAPWVNPESTVDRVIIGGPEREVRQCVVTWISSFRACRAAVERGADLLITHEPTFYGHYDRLPPETEIARQKQAFLEETGLTILRNHDVWDRFPDHGIPWSWARFLDLGREPADMANGDAQHRYDIAPVALGELARRFAAKTAQVGEPVLQVVGDDTQTVSRIGIGTGCACGLPVFLKMGCDCSIVCDDGSCYWSWLQVAEDLGHPVIRVNHGTSEEPGMVSMARYINENLPGVHAEYLAHRPAYHPISHGSPE